MNIFAIFLLLALLEMADGLPNKSDDHLRAECTGMTTVSQECQAYFSRR